MRLTPLISTAFVLFVSGSLFAQEWLNLPAGKIASHVISRRSRR